LFVSFFIENYGEQLPLQQEEKDREQRTEKLKEELELIFNVGLFA